MISKSGAPPAPRDSTKTVTPPPDDTAKEDIKTAVGSGNDEPGNSSLVAPAPPPTKKDKASRPPSSTVQKHEETQSADYQDTEHQMPEKGATPRRTGFRGPSHSGKKKNAM